MTDRVLTRAEQIRALTHPLRIRMIDLLRGGAEMTATEMAEATGESVASCSFHLRQLGRFGLIEPAPRRGREKPWRAAPHPVALGDDSDDPDVEAASRSAVRAFLQHSYDAIDRAIDRDGDDPVSAATAQTHAAFWVTGDELAELNRQISALAQRFREREQDPSLRPDGSRRVRLLAVTWTDDAHAEET
ncbi:ArsR/SmtB family transcription factor [Microbacterium sp. gxy059]|uniref:ArsR/SmtB family transcription factor n=1 Tax=Microbacterium sp. gxy059 TaxID=2957199 RepID=UPI003D968760